MAGEAVASPDGGRPTQQRRGAAVGRDGANDNGRARGGAVVGGSKRLPQRQRRGGTGLIGGARVGSEGAVGAQAGASSVRADALPPASVLRYLLSARGGHGDVIFARHRLIAEHGRQEEAHPHRPVRVDHGLCLGHTLQGHVVQHARHPRQQQLRRRVRGSQPQAVGG